MICKVGDVKQNAAAQDECKIKRNCSERTIETTQALFLYSEISKTEMSEMAREQNGGQSIVWFISSHL